MPIEFPPAVEEPMRRFDDVVNGWFDHLRGRPVPDRVFYMASELGDFSLIWHMAGLAKGLGPAGSSSAVRQAVALGAESALVNGLIKSWFRRARPETDEPRPHRLRTPKTTSFPSGHASSALLAAGLLSEGSRLRPLYYGAAAIVATSRIHVRIHHASDVAAGAVLGVGLAKVVETVAPIRPRTRRYRVR